MSLSHFLIVMGSRHLGDVVAQVEYLLLRVSEWRPVSGVIPVRKQRPLSGALSRLRLAQRSAASPDYADAMAGAGGEN